MSTKLQSVQLNEFILGWERTIESYKCSILDVSSLLLSSVQLEELGEEIVFVSHRTSMVYCFVAGVKLSMDKPPHETLWFNKPYLRVLTQF